MDILGNILIAISWYSIVGTSLGIGLIVYCLIAQILKKQYVRSVLITGFVLIGITVLIFLGFLLFGFMGAGLAQN